MPITINDSLQNNSPKPLNNKYGVFASGVFRPYNSIAEANSLIPVAYRHIGLTVLINVGGTPTEYWYRSGTSDGSLVEKVLTSTTTTTTTSTTTSSSTTSTTTFSAVSGHRYATAQDAINIANANEGDYLITGPNLSGGTVYITPSFNNTFTLDNTSSCKKVLIKGGIYNEIRIENPNVNGNSTCPIIITNYDGQVICKSLTVAGMSNIRITGKYDPVNGTGDTNFRGHDSAHAYSQYGIKVSNDWGGNVASFLITIEGFGNSVTDYELDYVESGNGGYANVFKTDNVTGYVDNVSIHDCYIHDVHGESVYIGNTQPGNQQIFRNTKFYNNKCLRIGRDGIQLVRQTENCEIYNNVIHGALNWKSPFGRYQDFAASLDFRGGDVSIRNNVFLHGAGTWLNFFTNLESWSGSVAGTINIQNNLFLHLRGPLGAYIGQNSFLPNITFNITGNVFGKMDYEYDQVYTDSANTNTVIRIANDATFSLTNNVFDGSGSKSVFHSVVGGFTPTITASNNTLASIDDVEFVNYIEQPFGFDYKKYEMWGSRVGDTWGNEAEFPFTGTLKGTPIVYNVGDYVVHKSRHYRCLVQHSQIEPEVTSGWATYWQPVLFNSNTTVIPPDDVRIVSSSIHNFLGRGLLTNPTYTGTTSSTTTSTSTTSTSSSSTTSTTTQAPDSTTPFIGIYDEGNEFLVKYAVNRNQITSSPLIVGIGSSTMAGTGATTGNSFASLFQTWLSSVSGNTGRFINAAQGSQDTTNGMPTGTSSAVNEHKNITMAMSARPTAIVIAFPSNDIANGLSANQYYTNILAMYNAARGNGIPCFVVSPQPRTGFTQVQQQALIDANNLMKGSIPSEFYIEVLGLLTDTASSKPADINPLYSSGDGIHLNNAGHLIIRNELVSKIDSYFIDYDGVFDQYELEYGTTSASGVVPSSWSTLDTITDTTLTESYYPKFTSGWRGYRLRKRKVSDASYTSYSNVVYLNQPFTRDVVDQTINIDFSTDTNGPPPAEWNNFSRANATIAAGETINLIDNTTAATGITLEVTKSFSGTALGGANSGIYPIKVMQDSFWISSSNKERSQLTIHNLSQNNAYSIEFIGGSAGNDVYRHLGIVTNSGNFDQCAMQSAPNTPNEFAVGYIEGVVPNGSNDIVLDLYAIGAVAYINGIVLRRYVNTESGGTTTTTTTTSTTTTSSSTTTTTTVAAGGSTININLYSGSNPYANSQWNNWNVGTAGSPTGFTDLKYDSGASTGFNIVWNTAHQGVADNGAAYGGGAFPAEALRYACYTTNAGFVAVGTSFTINGLNNSYAYTFEFIGSRSNTGNTTQYQVIGATTVTSSSLVTDSNKNNTITVSNIFPSAGAITIKFAVPSSGFAYLNGFKIYENGTPPTTTTTTSTSTTSTTTVAGTTTSTTSTSSSTTTTTTISGNNASTFTTGGAGWLSSDPAQRMWIYTPAGYNNGNSNNYPLIVFLHGQGESGTNINSVLSTGLPQLINQGQAMECLVICPQIPSGNWLSIRGQAALNWALANLRVDTNRVYFTGLSLGAIGTFDTLKLIPSQIAAYVAVAGTYALNVTTEAATMDAIKDKAGYFIHGDADTVTQSVNNTKDILDKFNAETPRGKFPHQCLIVRNGGHNSAVWNTQVYNKATARFDFEKFLLMHSLDAEYTATKYVEKVEELILAANYEEALHYYTKAFELVQALPNDSDKVALQTRNSTAKSTIDTNYGSRYIIDFGTTTSAGNINNITSGATNTTLSNIIDYNGGASTKGFTIVARAEFNDNTVSAPGMSADYFGIVKEGSSDGLPIFNTGTYRFTGLNNAKTYDLVVIGTKDTNAAGNNSQAPEITVTIGSTVKYLNIAHNTNRYIRFAGITPSSGNISFDVKRGWTLNAGVTPTTESTGCLSTSTSNVANYTATGTGIMSMAILVERP